MKEIQDKRKRNLAIFIGLIVILIVTINGQGGYIDQVNQCSKIKNHQCSSYDIAKLERN